MTCTLWVWVFTTSLCVVWYTRRYPSVVVFRHHNLRNELFKDLREQLKDTSKCVAHWL